MGALIAKLVGTLRHCETTWTHSQEPLITFRVENLAAIVLETRP